MVLGLHPLPFLISIWFIFFYITDSICFFAQVGTPICVRRKGFFIDIGRISSIENNHKHVDVAKKGHKVAIKVCVCLNH
jgi:hypothetical protein